jgi:aerobic carbon-monoxide dehydrogenase medium subunit
MRGQIHFASSIDDAEAAVRAGATPLAGATWIMRAPIRREISTTAGYVALSRIPALRDIDVTESEIRIGACVTHADIAARLAPFEECAGLASAAATSANPAIRNVATIGGNICAAAFAASDLAPALLALDARVVVAAGGRREHFGIVDFLSRRSCLTGIVTSFLAPRSPRRAAHVRLPLRKAGDYPVAIVSVSTAIDHERRLGNPRISVGSVEAVGRRWAHLENVLDGSVLSPQSASRRAESMVGDFVGRDGIEAPGWYRVKVLPVLVRRAFQALEDSLVAKMVL